MMGETGWFPSAYCSAPFDEGMEEGETPANVAPTGQPARALYSFQASAPDELSFEAGDLLQVTASDQSWWRTHSTNRYSSLARP